ncbi:MAG: DNA-3-methyladenine glycosylase 2 family protein [Myxococcota bacterium]
MDSPATLKGMVDAVAENDGRVRALVASVGYPAPRLRPAGFGALLRIILGQQVSVAAARTIAGRVWAMMDDAPSAAKLSTLPDPALRGAGLSRQKLAYARSLADALESGALNLDALSQMNDEAAIKALTAVKGLGRWSAEMYLMFSLQRPDIWPVGDLGVREGVRRVFRLETRPSPAETRTLGEGWRPHRSVMAMMMWRILNNAP